MLAQEVPDPCQNRAPDGGANGRVQDELRQRHAVQPGGDRNEVADHGKEAADQRTDLAMLGEKALRALEVLLTQEEVLAVALDERPADQLSPVIVGKRTDDTAQHAAEQRHRKAHLPFGRPAARWVPARSTTPSP